MGVSYLIGGAAWLAVLGYFAWRILNCRKMLIPVNQEISWVVYLLTLPLPKLVGVWFPGVAPAPAAIVFVFWRVPGAYTHHTLTIMFKSWV